MRARRGATLVEFALAWPLLLAAVLGAVQVTLWAIEAHAARTAALAGARAGSRVGATPAAAEAVSLAVLGPFLFGTAAHAWCPGAPEARPAGVWVCGRPAPGGAIEVLVGGSVPALVPLPAAPSLPVGADVTLPAEVFG